MQAFEIQRYLEDNKEYQKIKDYITKSSKTCDIDIENTYGSSTALIASRLFLDLRQKSLVCVTPTTVAAERLYQDIKTFLHLDKVFYFPPWEILPYEPISPFYDIVHNRIEVLHKIILGEPIIVVTPIINLMKTIIPKEAFKDEYLILKLGDDINYKDTISNLVELGYRREHKVEEPGSFSVKGGIIDIFPSSSKEPLRIELFDTNVCSIRVFDVGTQRSKAELEMVEILPQRELIFTEKSIRDAVNNIEARFLGDRYKDKAKALEKIKDRVYFQGIEHLLPLFYNERATLIDYFNLEESFFIFDEELQIQQKGKAIYDECISLFNQSHKANILKVNPNELYLDYNSVYDKLLNRIRLSKFPFIDKENVYTMPIKSTTPYGGSMELFRETAVAKLNDGFKIFILASYKGQAKRLNDLFIDLNPTLIDDANNSSAKTNSQSLEKGLYIVVADINEGFSIEGDSPIIVILDRQIFARKKSFYKKLRKVSSSPIASFYDLKKDDLVVHVNYGVGRYVGIERIKALGKEKDCILILYDEDEKLFIPIEQLNLMQKYIGSRGANARLDKLGSTKWEKTKAKVKKDLEKVARELITLYAKRKELRAYAFMPDSKWQQDFELGFEYEETEDQLRAVEEIKQDMESHSPMDRLICGDVGFGKTEVAIRAAFKAVMSGKQVAILVPTTILCEQHYRTLKSRFELYPVKIEMLFRLQSTKEQRLTIARLKAGEIDIVIGTHKIVSKDVEFRSLGLLIIDEEQRFGVAHKEAIKKLRTNVDVLSMSATPIPRTLHMSLIKIRNMSIIDTPPENRRPIETYTTEFNEDIIKDAIQRELDRDGQVFFIFNRVKTIKSFARYLGTLIPNSRVCVVHGQMDEKEADSILRAFIDKDYDILVSTTILESGIDISNANTILIDRADALGLAQLYQLRGRVGRGGRRAYCYLFYPADKAITEIAQKRLAVVNEYSDLGSGFKIAMKDMEFRGAGNVLGMEQSGSIVSVGFELYCKLLDIAVKELMEEDLIYDYDVYVDLEYDAFIPDSYIGDEKQKIELYKKIAALTSYDELASLKEELKDRFGNMPPIILNLLKIAHIKIMAKELLVVSIVELHEELAICFNERSLVRAENIIVLASSYSNLIRINPQKSNYLYIKCSSMPFDEKIDFIDLILSSLSA